MTGHPEFPHLDEHGSAWMIDITGKQPTVRRAVARGTVRTAIDVFEALTTASADLDPVQAARVAGMQAAKQTSALVPLCHPIRLTDVQVDVILGEGRVDISARTEVVDRTGVEMEALTACTVAGLTIVCALSGADPEAYLDEVTLWLKEGGRTGRWERSAT
ncbi:MAG TPA: cyclic pyranopterin monophosphate synthase MoaC, partial [Acidimicrobiales bacterium]|nr:cyclic pyranopterin monophosphate synthase MoaC [Acidimicrobiales bacterium]